MRYGAEGRATEGARRPHVEVEHAEEEAPEETSAPSVRSSPEGTTTRSTSPGWSAEARGLPRADREGRAAEAQEHQRDARDDAALERHARHTRANQPASVRSPAFTA